MLSNEEKIKRFDSLKETQLKYRVKQKLLLQKCQEKGIIVSDKEVEEELKRMSAKK